MKGRGGGRHGAKRTALDPLEAVQAANRQWWESTPMTYDWRGNAELEVGTAEWFNDQDRRSDAEHAHFLHGRPAFDLVLGKLPLDGLEVLEIGVGSGFHSELLARRSARVTGIDLANPAVELTRARFLQRGLAGEFFAWDAELDQERFHNRFDLVWSWGVIHHSAHTARIVRNIHRWLRPGGTFGGMVYHRDSTRLGIALLREWVLRQDWRSTSIDEALYRGTDGFSARFYPADQWRDLLLAFFDQAETTVSGLDVDLIPLPSSLRRPVWQRLSCETQEQLLRRVGHFLMFRAHSPRE